MKLTPRIFAAAVLLGAAAHAAPARADDIWYEPWSDADPKSEWRRYALGDFGFRAGAEYRAQMVYINPISLNTESAGEVSWIEHRLRADLGVDYKDKVRLVFSSDVMDGVLWGDNGAYGGDPAANAGTNVNAKNPNAARPCVTLRSGDPLDPSSYGYGICSTSYLTVRKLYGEVYLPFGVLRIGRQPGNLGTGVQTADGEGRPNRFGVSHTGNVVDRVLFATKPLEAFKPKDQRSTSANDGLIFAFGYDRWVSDDPQHLASAVNQWDTALRFAAPKWPLGHHLLLAAYHAYRWDGEFSSKIHSFGARAMSGFGPVSFGVEVASNLGSTREIASSYHVITNDPIVDQTVRQLGARAVLRYDHKYFSVYLEGDFASGDDDPQARTPLTQFTFAEDSNVGLLMFEHILAFQTARAAAAGVETLRRLGAPSLPAEAVSSRGSFTNAVAVFPQIDVRPLPGLLLRGGVLAAWAPSRVVDPVASLQRRDGLTIEDDLVNFAGGKPGRYYGTEIDGRIQYRFLDHFLLDLEGAILFPGDALENRDGYAVRSGMMNVRTTFFF